MTYIVDEVLAKHETAIKALFPDTFTHVANINMLAVRYQLKLLGFDYRTEQEFATLMALFETKGLILRDGMMLKRTLHRVYKPC